MNKTPIILASSSEIRQQLLARILTPLNLSFDCISPNIDETSQGEQHADELAYRLAKQKAHVIAQQYPNALVIGSDQVAWCADNPSVFLGKPITEENAVQQLLNHSGKILNFSTGLSVQHLNQEFECTCVAHYQVQFRDLTEIEIRRYIAIDKPLYCAGSFKAESLGISLFNKMHGDDFNTLLGLPVIELCKILRMYGLNMP